MRFCSAGMAALGIAAATVAMVSVAPAPAHAGDSASLIAGRGRVKIHLPAPAPAGPDRYEFVVDGVNQCKPTCGGFPVVKLVPHGKDVLGSADAIFGVPAGHHRIEVRFPGSPDMLDRQVTVLPPNQQQDTDQCSPLPNPSTLSAGPTPSDPTLNCSY